MNILSSILPKLPEIDAINLLPSGVATLLQAAFLHTQIRGSLANQFCATGRIASLGKPSNSSLAYVCYDTYACMIPVAAHTIIGCRK